jgi:outer membrane protein TolC
LQALSLHKFSEGKFETLVVALHINTHFNSKKHLCMKKGNHKGCSYKEQIHFVIIKIDLKMKKKAIILYYLLLAGQASLLAQTPLTLQQAIEQGLKNRKDLKNQEIAVQITENELQKIQTRNLPKLDASLDMRYNAQLQTNVIPAGVFGAEARNVRFGTNFNNLVGLNATYDLYNPNTKADKKIALQNIEIDKLNIQKIQTDIKHAIIQAYYSVLLNQEKLKFSRENLSRTEKYWQEGKTKLDNKTILQTDFDKLVLDKENAQLIVEEDAKNLATNKLYLANQMGVEGSVEIAETMESFKQNNLPTNPSGIDNRVEIKQEQSRIALFQANIDKQQKSYLPTVSLYGAWNAQNLTNDFSLVGKNAWFPFSYVGARVSVNIFDGNLKRYNKQDYTLRIQQSQNTLTKLRQDYQYEVQSAVTEMQNITAKINQAQQNIQLAQKVLEVDTVRFREGKITASELKNTEYSLLTAQNNVIVQYYNLLVAKLKYQKAVGE